MNTSTIVSIDWLGVFKLAGAVFTSLGGGTVIALAIIRYTSNRIAEGLKSKYQLEMDKKLTDYKSEIEKKLDNYKATLSAKQYVTQKKFDCEFQIYQELTEKFFDLVDAVGAMIPYGLVYKSADEEIQKEVENKAFETCQKKCIEARSSIRKNAPFIPDSFYKKYIEILDLCDLQLRAFMRRWDKGYIAPQSVKEKLNPEDYMRTREIENEFDKLNGEIRGYLDSLDVI